MKFISLVEVNPITSEMHVKNVAMTPDGFAQLNSDLLKLIEVGHGFVLDDSIREGDTKPGGFNGQA